MNVVGRILALLLAVLALPALADREHTARVDSFAQYAYSWCTLGNEQGCTIFYQLGMLSHLLNSAAERCDTGDRDGCADAWAMRRYFYTTWGRLPVEPDMRFGEDGSLPRRPIWDQPEPEPWFPANCDAFIPACGYFGDPRRPGDFSHAYGSTFDPAILDRHIPPYRQPCMAFIPACGYPDGMPDYSRNRWILEPQDSD